MALGKPIVAQCPRDQTIVLVAEIAGLHVAVDSTPLSLQGFADAFVVGVGLWRLTVGSGGASGRLDRPPAGWKPEWGVNGAQTGAQRLHAEHSCGAHAKDMRPLGLKSAEKGPRRASATSGALPGGSRRSAAPAGATGALGRPSPATSATHLRSRPSCDICGRIITEPGSFSSIECGRYTWAVHEECP